MYYLRFTETDFWVKEVIYYKKTTRYSKTKDLSERVALTLDHVKTIKAKLFYAFQVFDENGNQISNSCFSKNKP